MIEAPRSSAPKSGWVGGGTEGNERLTTMASAILIVLLAVLGITIQRIRQLIWPHLFVGLMLLGPLAVKMASTGYRFVRYYARNAPYRLKGPPPMLMRLLAPSVVVSTTVVFASGVLLLAAGPSERDQYLLLHKISFIVWLGVTGLHVLGHLRTFAAGLRTMRVDELNGSSAGSAGRLIAIASALVAGIVLAVALIPQFGPWTAHGALGHHH